MLRQWRDERQRVLEGARCSDRAHARAVLRQALDPVRARARVHDFMHAKVDGRRRRRRSSAASTSRTPASANAENVLEIPDPALADRLAAFVDGIRERYPAIDL